MNNILKKSWILVNVENLESTWNETFRLPTRLDRENLVPGDRVQLHFFPDGAAVERLWVDIIEVEDGLYKGELAQVPASFGIELFAEISFGPEHIGRIQIVPGNPLWCDCYEKQAIVSARALEPGKGVCFAYREPPAHEDDSGWRLTEGTEDEAYMEDISNARLVVAGALIDRDLSLAAVFRGEFGDDCRRNGIDKPWYACDAGEED